MAITSIENIDFSEKKVVIRLDLNVPIQNKKIQDITRIERIIPTLKMILSKNPKYIVILSHLGRPKPKPPSLWDEDNSLAIIKPSLQKLLELPITFTKKPIGPELYHLLNTLPNHSIILAENIRFYEGEEINSDAFSKAISQLGDIFVNEAFSCSHRKHASVVGITKHLPSYAGLCLSEELHALGGILTHPNRPTIGIVAGSKISTKIDLLLNLLNQLDYLFLGGGMANTFLKAEGYKIGKSLVENEYLDTAKTIMKKAQKSKCRLVLPIDAVVAKELKTNTPTAIVDIDMIDGEQAIYDIGPKTIEKLKNILQSCKTVLWNGPVGAYEISPFAQGSIAITKIITQQTKTQELISIAGGGDTIAVIAESAAEFTYVSTAGGAFLEWLEGKKLPGIESLDPDQIVV